MRGRLKKIDVMSTMLESCEPKSITGSEKRKIITPNRCSSVSLRKIPTSRRPLPASQGRERIMGSDQGNIPSTT